MFFFVSFEQIGPDCSGEPHIEGGKCDEHQSDQNDDPHIEHALKEQPPDKIGNHGLGNAQGIAYVHGPEEKSRFLFKSVATLITFFVHLGPAQFEMTFTLVIDEQKM